MLTIKVVDVHTCNALHTSKVINPFEPSKFIYWSSACLWVRINVLAVHVFVESLVPTGVTKGVMFILLLWEVWPFFV